MKKYKVTAVLGSSLEESLARVLGALERIQNSDILILSGKGIARKMAEYARKLGYTKEELWDDYATSTYENAKNIKSIIKSVLKNDVSKLYIVTSSYHVPSVTLIFGKALKNEPYKFKIIGTYSSYSSKNLLKSIIIEVLSIFQDVLSIYLCKVLEREDIYDKTLRKIKKMLVK